MRIKPKRTFVTRNTSSSLLKSFVFLACFLLVSVTNIYAQTKTITGTVTDEFNEALIGVSVRVQGTTTGTLTDVDGAYSISANTGDMLEFTYVGMKTQLIKVGATNTINVSLKDDAQMLAETVVIGYGSAKKRDLTGSIVSIKAEDFANRPPSNALASLQGRIAGVQVVNSGRAGQDPEIRIRGTNSINGFTPLYVVDGLFCDNINFLNPLDIESMEILKDPSSLAIFGVRGANGVIIVTTKKAKDGQMVVNFNTSVGFKSVVDKIKLTNAAQFKELYSERLLQEGSKPFDFSNWTADTNWQDEIFQTGLITNNNISVLSSTDKNKLYMGVSYMYEEGSIIHEKFSKLSINLSNDHSLTKDIKIGFQFNAARILPPDAKNVTDALYATPVAPVYENFVHPKTGQMERLFSSLPNFQKAQINNPMVDVELRNNTTLATNYRAGGNIYGDVNFLKHFNFRTTFSMEYRSDDSRRYTPIIRIYDREITTGIPVDTLGTRRTAISQTKLNETKIQADYILTYTNSFNDHNITGTAGFTTFYNELSSITAARNQGNGFPIPNDPNLWYVSMGDNDASTTGSTQWDRSTVSFLLRALYNYKNKYLFNGSFRRDGSSAFFYTGNQWQNFYSVGGGWVMSEEKFMEDVKFLDYLKLKGSWGTLGNQNMSMAYPAQPIMVSSSSAVFGDNIIPGLGPEYLPNPNLRWEKIEAWEAGFEAQTLNSRLRFEGVYYRKNTKDLLAQVPGISGTIPGLGNLGSLENKGVELNLSWADKIGSDWTYGVSGNLTTINNKVLSLVQDGFRRTDGVRDIANTIAGYPIGYFYGYVVEGVYQNNSDIKLSPANTLATVQPGDLKFKDVDGNGEITTADRTMIGNPTPDVIYGLTFNLGYKNFDFSVDMMGVYGNEIYRTWDNNNWSTFNYMLHRVDRWNGEGTSNWEPILNTQRAINRENSTYFIEDGSFFRVRNIQLGYTFDQNALKKLKIKSLKLFVNAQNPKTWKRNTGYTPEVGGSATAFGIDNVTYPMPAVYTFGANFTF